MLEDPSGNGGLSNKENDAAERKDSGLLLAVKYSHIGFALPAGTVVGWFIGAALDLWLGTTWIRIAGLIVGIIAGFAEMIRAIMQISKESQ
jgi:F0F1-type ATP synthase assembly protein I